MKQNAPKSKDISWARFFAYAIIISAIIIWLFMVMDSFYQTALQYQNK